MGRRHNNTFRGCPTELRKLFFSVEGFDASQREMGEPLAVVDEIMDAL